MRVNKQRMLDSFPFIVISAQWKIVKAGITRNREYNMKSLLGFYGYYDIPYAHTWPGRVKTKHKGRHGRFEQRKIAAQKRHAKSRNKRWLIPVIKL